MYVDTKSIYYMNFKAMKPNQFKGFDYAALRKFKAPVEKFNSTADLQDWAVLQFSKLCKKTFEHQKNDIELERKLAINKWKDFLQEKDEIWSPTKILVVFSSILGGMKRNNNIVPPAIREDVIDNTCNDIENSLSLNRDKPFSFEKIYNEKLSKYFLRDIPKDYTGWIILDSKRKNPTEFEDNVERLKRLSLKHWCTRKTFSAESFLSQGDFHLYLKDGETKIAVRFFGVDIQEIQGENFNITSIPEEYVKEIEKHIEESKYFLNEDIGFLINLLENRVKGNFDYY